MKKIILVIVCLAVGMGCLAQSKIVTESVPSKALGRDVSVNVYLPDGYDHDGHYPVLYLLHGLYGTHKDWPSVGGLPGVADELMASGEARRMVIVMPCAGDPDVHHVQNGYFNMPGYNYEDFFFGELIPAMESKYHCGGSKGQRAIQGLSMGGGGSVVYAQRHPDMFSSCYGMSAWLTNDSRSLKDQTDKNDKLYIVSKSVIEHSALDYVDNATPEILKSLRTVKWFIDCGDDDFLLQINMDLHMKMRAKGIKGELRVRDGAHTWEYWHTALRLSLPFASRNFSE